MSSLLSLLLITLLNTAHANYFTPNHPCAADFKVFCKPDEVPRKKNYFRCLYMRFNDLNPKCQAFISEQLKELPCFPESMRLCLGPHRNMDRYESCLNAQIKYVSKKCREELGASKREVEKITALLNQYCSETDKALCPEKSFYKRYGCLRDMGYEEKLSKECALRLNFIPEFVKFPDPHPCRMDTARFCTKLDFPPAKSNNFECLTVYMSKLEQSCRQWILDEMREAPCTSDALKFCSGEQLDLGNVFDCLKRRNSELTERCRASIADAEKEFQVDQLFFNKHCSDDDQRICTQPTFPMRYRCWVQSSRVGKLSPNCVSNMRAKYPEFRVQ